MMNNKAENIIIETLATKAEILEALHQIVRKQSQEIQELQETLLAMDKELACKLMHWREK